ncbi:MAG: sugar phosphate isomerase/epimerase [Candidatus Solibacter sp.]|nr:sugar phosphate isomerase/epimerase [Candidatus Solibacter sp.]
MQPKLELAAITDEFTPELERALDAMAAIGMTGAELRVVWGKNIMDLTDDEVARAVDAVKSRGMHVLGISSPILKCVLPGGHVLDTRFQQDIFASKHTFDDQPRLADRAFKLCGMTGAKIIRVFSYWRTLEPERCHDAICEAVASLADQAKAHGVIIGIENEHACNIGTASEALKILNAVQHPNLKLVWDPANMLVGGEDPYPAGYGVLPIDRIAHVHAKDCHMEGHKPVWGPLGTRHVDWKGQISALLRDGYTGAVSLETHWPGPNNNKFEASVICGWNLRGLLAS